MLQRLLHRPHTGFRATARAAGQTFSLL
jgi:hypothetical protein